MSHDTFLAFICSLTFFRHRWQPHHSSTACAYLGCEPFAETRLAPPRSECSDEENRTPLTSQGTFAYTYIGFPNRCFRSLKDKETPEVDNNDRSTITTSQLAIHLINTRLGALTLAPRLSKLKVVALGHPPLALAAPLLTASFGRTPLSYRMLFSTTIGV